MRRSTLLVIATVLPLCFVTGCFEVSEPHCVRTDLTQLAPPPFRGEDYPGPEWFHDAMVCSIGNYQFATPADGSTDAYMVLREDSGEVYRSDASSISIMENFDLILSIDDTDNDGVSDRMSYDNRRYDGDRRLSVIDFNIDGQPDLRTLELPDGSKRHDVWAENTWHHVNFKGLTLVADPTRRARLADDGTFVIEEK